MPRSPSPVLLILLMLVSTSCRDDPTSLEEVVVIQTDQSRYSIDESIVITVENHGQDPVLFQHCDYRLGFEVERQVKQQWQHQFDVATVCPTIYMSGEYRLEPGATYQDSVRMGGPGTYRLRFLAGQRAGDRVHSNTFEVK